MMKKPQAGIELAPFWSKLLLSLPAIQSRTVPEQNAYIVLCKKIRIKQNCASFLSFKAFSRRLFLLLSVILFADWTWSEIIWIRIEWRPQGSPTAGSVQDCHGYAWVQCEKNTWIEYFLKFWNMINYIGTRDINVSLKRRCHEVSRKNVFLCWVSWNLWRWKCNKSIFQCCTVYVVMALGNKFLFLQIFPSSTGVL
jgi:hypothetical protein